MCLKGVLVCLCLLYLCDVGGLKEEASVSTDLEQNKNTSLTLPDVFLKLERIKENDSITNNTKKIDRKRKKKHGKKKTSQQRRKKKQNNILEITTAKTIQTNHSAIIANITKNPDKFLNEILKLRKNSTKKRNRCTRNNGGCSQICRPRGKLKCGCLKGYTLAKNRKKCVDINECKVRNGGCAQICRNTRGAFYCDCPAGLRIAENSKSCEDINECHLRNGHGPCQGSCRNFYGSYSCTCPNGTRLGPDKHSCKDINECKVYNPGCSHFCINTRVGAFCSCPQGMELMSDYKTCQDIDECENHLKTKCKQGCVNTVGSYYCEDNLQNDLGNKSKIVSCPPLEPPKFGFITCLRNNSFENFGKSGRKIVANYPGTRCRLECPEGFKLVGSGRFLCSLSGKWHKKRGFCTRAPYPKLDCPPDQTFTLEKNQKTALVHFPSPQTNVRWKIVKSYPEWAKTLRGELTEGRYNIQFSVTDPESKLSSTCSFFITIKTQ
ncbi:signal peptide, CUB and EGF-like domain-containing protein 2 [Tribolium castaneum]|uniref:signal peptide, CUB and EGF-like domain-containing protein 2 n=1 Tax=Tribolium castaneum TaxID=7070 RepID=UPI0030FE48A6